MEVAADEDKGDQRRTAAASKTVSDFGMAAEYGWDHGDPNRARGLLDSHRIWCVRRCNARGLKVAGAALATEHTTK